MVRSSRLAAPVCSAACKFTGHTAPDADDIHTSFGASCKFKGTTANRCKPNGSSAPHDKFYFIFFT